MLHDRILPVSWCQSLLLVIYTMRHAGREKTDFSGPSLDQYYRHETSIYFKIGINMFDVTYNLQIKFSRKSHVYILFSKPKLVNHTTTAYCTPF